MTRRYPLAPFLQLTGWSMSDVSRVSPANGAEYRLRRSEGVTELVADRLAVAAGLHSWNVWPELADHATRECVAEDCTERFFPRDKANIWCSRRCYQRVKMRRYRATEVGAENNRKWRRAWYAECAEYDIAQGRRRRLARKQDAA